ncbi:MAG: BON domain-containing protein [Pirellulales bacterium]
MNDDQEKLAARIERLVRRQTNDKVRELRVVVLSERIILSGRCGTFYSKQLAQHAAMTLADESPLVNQIDVW